MQIPRLRQAAEMEAEHTAEEAKTAEEKTGGKHSIKDIIAATSNPEEEA